MDQNVEPKREGRGGSLQPRPPWAVAAAAMRGLWGSAAFLAPGPMLQDLGVGVRCLFPACTTCGQVSEPSLGSAPAMRGARCRGPGPREGPPQPTPLKEEPTDLASSLSTALKRGNLDLYRDK